MAGAAFVALPWVLVLALEIKLALNDNSVLRMGEYCLELPKGCSLSAQGPQQMNVYCKDGTLLIAEFSQNDESVKPSTWRRLDPLSSEHQEYYEFEAGLLKVRLKHSYPEKPSLQVVKPSPCL